MVASGATAAASTTTSCGEAGHRVGWLAGGAVGRTSLTLSRRLNGSGSPMAATLTPHPPPTIVAARPADAGPIAGLHRAVFAEGWDEGGTAALLTQPTTRAWLATLADAFCGAPPVLAGFLIARLVLDEAEILSIGVASEQRRSGLGGQLVECLHAACREAGVRRVFLEVAVGNTAARALYARHGYLLVARRARYYSRAGGVQEDALVLAHDLPQVRSRPADG